MGVKCIDCRHCELLELDNYKCHAQKFITMTYYGACEFERTCRHYEEEDKSMSKFEVTNEAIPIEASIFGDIYTYYRSLYNGDNSEEYINEVYCGFDALKAKYNDDPLCMSLLVAVTTDLQHPDRRPIRYNTGGKK